MASRTYERISGYLRDALLALLEEMPFEDITVQDVAEVAGVSKSTLYSHYANLADLLQDCFLSAIVYFGPEHKRRADYASRRDAISERMETSARMLSMFKSNPHLGRAVLFGCRDDAFNGAPRYEHEEEDLTIDHIVTEYGDASFTSDFLDCEACARFVFAGTFGLYRRWMRDGMTVPIETVVRQAAYFSLQCTAGMVNKPIEPEYKAAIDGWHYERFPCSDDATVAVTVRRA